MRFQQSTVHARKTAGQESQLRLSAQPNSYLESADRCLAKPFAPMDEYERLIVGQQTAGPEQASIAAVAPVADSEAKSSAPSRYSGIGP